MRVQVFHLNHAYLEGHPTLKDISLDLPSGSLNFLVGPSGSGKSTLMRLIFGEESIQSGQILAGSWSLSHLTEKRLPHYRRQVGYIYQDLRLLPTWSAEENVMLPLEAIGVPRKTQRARAHELLHQVGLGHHSQTPINQLSGGEQQRVAIARALVHNPLMVIADEPTANLDPALTHEIMQLLFEQRLRGVTLLISTHDHELLSTYPSKVIELKSGQVSRQFDMSEDPLTSSLSSVV